MTTAADKIPRLKWTLVFITCGEEVLLLYRRYEPNSGKWNGVGGKLEPDETPLACAIRELFEETGIELDNLRFGGTVTWNEDAGERGGMYVYIGNIERKPFEWIDTAEGSLTWLPLKNVLDEAELVDNIPHYLPAMLAGAALQEWACEYDENRQLVGVTRLPMVEHAEEGQA